MLIKKRTDTVRYIRKYSNPCRSLPGEPLRFVDDLDIAKNGVIYFSNATQRNPEIVENEAWEQRASGALFRYFPKTKKTELLQKDLFFANGIALHPSEEYLILSETFGLGYTNIDKRKESRTT